MSNDWFQFREFLIRQDRSAMKVGTDGVLLGAWANIRRDAYLRPFELRPFELRPFELRPFELRPFELRPFGSRQPAGGMGNVLDIGTGTGLVALMMAQRFEEARIVAVEMDVDAAQQAEENVGGSVWSDRIEVIRADFRDWEPASGVKFDLIVCNPPFFSRSLKNPDARRSTARHDDDLSLSELIPKSVGMLTGEGALALILPVGRMQDAIDLAGKSGLFLHRRMDVKGNPNTSPKRVLLEWGLTEGAIEFTELVIETDVRGVYSKDYRRLTGAFYPRPHFR